MTVALDLSALSPYELGLIDSGEAIPHVIQFLRTGQSNERRLAASAVRKLTQKYRDDCKSAIPALLACLEDPGPQARQYALKALDELALPPNALAPIRAIYESDEKDYNRSIAGIILRKYGAANTTAENGSPRKMTDSIDLLQFRIEGCLDDIDVLEEDLQEQLNWLWDAEEKVTQLRLELQRAEQQLIIQGIEGKNQAERDARLAEALAGERKALEDAEQQLRSARRVKDAYQAKLTLLQHRLHALELLVSLRRSRAE